MKSPKCLTIRSRLIVAFGIAFCAIAVLASFCFYSLHLANDHLVDVYDNRLIPVAKMAQINDTIHQNSNLLMVALISRAAPQNIKRYTDTVETNLKDIDQLMDDYLKSNITPDEKKLAEEWTQKKNHYVSISVVPGIKQMLDGKFTDAEDTLTATGKKPLQRLQETMDQLMSLQMRVAKETYDRAQAEVRRNWEVVSLILGLSVLFCLGVAVMIRTITAPISCLVKSVRAVANGDMATPIYGVHRADEIGPLAGALEKWRVNLEEEYRRELLKEEKAQRRAQAQEQIAKKMNEFDKTVLSMLERMRAAISNLQTTADVLSANASRTQKKIEKVVATTNSATEEIHAASQSGNQLLTSIENLAKEVDASSKMVCAAAEEAQMSKRHIGDLSDSTQKIGDVVDLIGQIASQTNLLALNATIESARAGEVGKGFAVVAHEVKSLSSKTSAATHTISEQIMSVQQQTKDAVQATGNIAQTIISFDAATTNIVKALSQQSNATHAIAHNIEMAVSGFGEITSDLQVVTDSSHETDAVAQKVLAAAQTLRGESETLEAEIRQFLQEVRGIG